MTWRNFCESIDSTDGTAKLKKSKESSIDSYLYMVSRDDGSFTESSIETNEVLLNTHFPGGSDLSTTNAVTTKGILHEWKAEGLGEIISITKIRWTIGSFEAYKSPDIDVIFPKTIQSTIDIVAPFLCSIYKGCLHITSYPYPGGSLRWSLYLRRGRWDTMHQKTLGL